MRTKSTNVPITVVVNIIIIIIFYFDRRPEGEKVNVMDDGRDAFRTDESSDRRLLGL